MNQIRIFDVTGKDIGSGMELVRICDSTGKNPIIWKQV